MAYHSHFHSEGNDQLEKRGEESLSSMHPSVHSYFQYAHIHMHIHVHRNTHMHTRVHIHICMYMCV